VGDIDRTRPAVLGRKVRIAHPDLQHPSLGSIELGPEPSQAADVTGKSRFRSGGHLFLLWAPATEGWARVGEPDSQAVGLDQAGERGELATALLSAAS
jgi:hypothetical protein